MRWSLLLAAGALVAAEPKLASLYPFTGQLGTTFAVTLRGNALRGTTAIHSANPALAVTIEGSEVEPPAASGGGRNRAAFDLLRLRVRTTAESKPGRYMLRVISPGGISNALPLYLRDQPVTAEPEGSHETPESAVVAPPFPAIFTGRIARRGESDFYALDVKAGEKLTFQVLSGLPSVGAAGGNANGFDPSISIFEQSGSWFDSKRLKRIAFNDEPLWVLGQLTDAHLSRQFEKAGRYFLRVDAFSGQGGPDYGYELRILPGEQAPEKSSSREGWEERGFPRRLAANRLEELAARGGKKADQKSIETYRAGGEFKLPAIIEGEIARPGDAQRARFHLDGPKDIAIEIETPGLAPPLFNPIVRLLDSANEEVATNISVGRGACTGAMSKSIQAKTIVPLRDPGDYTIEIRDTTADLGDPGFRYRILVRAQVPHVGQVRIDDDHINISPGEAKTIRVVFDREEDFRGAVAVVAEGLPPGVQAMAGADYEPDKDPPPFKGKRERYTPRTERTVIVFTAAAEAAPSNELRMARIVVRPIVDGKPGAVLAARQIPMMVVAKP